MSEKMKKLQAPFAAADIEWRAQSVGIDSNGKPYAKVLAYVTNRAIQQRLDDTFCIDKWKNEFLPAPDGGVMCGISIKFDEWVTKYDAAPNTDIEAVKGGISNAMKRAAVQWGIGRYLYNLEVQFAECTLNKQSGKEWVYATDKLSKTKFWWKIPPLPKTALPENDKSQSIAAEGEPTEPTADEAFEKPQKITEAQVNEIKKLVTDTGSDMQKLLTAYKVSDIIELHPTQYNDAIMRLKQKPKIENEKVKV